MLVFKPAGWYFKSRKRYQDFGWIFSSLCLLQSNASSERDCDKDITSLTKNLH